MGNHNPTSPFKKGNTAAVGHSTSGKELRDNFRRVMLECITDEDFQNIFKSLMEQCLCEDDKISLAAKKIFLEFIVVKPKQEIAATVEAALSKEELCKLTKDIIDSNLGLKKE